MRPRLHIAVAVAALLFAMSAAAEPVTFHAYPIHGIRDDARRSQLLYDRTDLFVVRAFVTNFSGAPVGIGTWPDTLSISLTRDGKPFDDFTIRVENHFLGTSAFQRNGQPLREYTLVPRGDGAYFPDVEYDALVTTETAVSRSPLHLQPTGSFRADLVFLGADGRPLPPGRYALTIRWQQPGEVPQVETLSIVCEPPFTDDDRAAAALVAAGASGREIEALREALKVFPRSPSLRGALVRALLIARRVDEANAVRAEMDALAAE